MAFKYLEGKNCKPTAGFKLMTNRFVTDTLTYPLHDAVLLHIRRRNHFSVKLYLILLFLCHIIEVSHTTLIEDWLWIKGTISWTLYRQILCTNVLTMGSKLTYHRKNTASIFANQAFSVHFAKNLSLAQKHLIFS